LKILLDENMPAALAGFLLGHSVEHVDDLGLKSLRNGALLAYARDTFDVLITLDRGILFQHNHRGQSLRIIVVRVSDSRKATILSKAADILVCLDVIEEGQHTEVS
jgi:predicted nuclease of predicted toxin-antitoxin system